ncbi:MAG: ZIP family metal transporter [Halobacteriovoraceae bacterium]|nr:ZIP family metal transporter [Halobacteriovoraceae bacterium]|tara:strand:+ start:18185 stop:18952 length:768 start_codon:yes stop_codon:yes gene_type:complete
MTDTWITITGTLVAGISTGIGALPIYFKKNYSKKSLDIGMGFSAGIMLVASFVSLIFPAIETAQQIYLSRSAFPLVLLGLICGYLFIITFHEFLPHDHVFKSKDVTHKKKISRVTLIVLAISLHNFPEGLAVGVGFGSGDMSSGVTLALAISLQNMPEGLVVAFGLLSEGASKHKAFLMALLSGLIEPLAAGFGFMATSISEYSLPVALSFAGGTMLFVICQEIFPEIFREGHERSATVGVISGVIIMLALDFYL